MRHDKLNRELSLLLLLTENKKLNVQQLCEKMELSKRTLYYYLDFFRDFGFEVEKRGTVYSIDKNSTYFTKLFRKVHFTEDEAIYIRRMLENYGGQGALVAHLKRKLDTIYDFNILADAQLREQQALNISVLYDAIKYHRNVILHHYSSPHSNSVSDRIVEPFMLMNDNREVRCYELTSKMNKTFKLARMESVELLADEWQHESQHRQMYTDIFMFSGEQQMRIKLRLGRLSANIIQEEYPLSAAYISKDNDTHWILELDVCSYIGIGRFVMGLFSDIEVLEDSGFCKYIHDKVKEMEEKIKNTP